MNSDPSTHEQCELTDLEKAAFMGIFWASCFLSLTAPISEFLLRITGPVSSSVSDVVERKMHYAWR